MTEKGLSGNALKVIAIVAMTIDHLSWVGIETYEQAETPTQIFLHCIGRLDGHIVQGHVDETARCTAMEDANGSTYFTFEYKDDREMARHGYFTVDKGSVTINGVSLTVCNPTRNTFQVAIIPYTMEHTNFQDIRVGTVVNLEFDIIGKYIARLQQL